MLAQRGEQEVDDPALSGQDVGLDRHAGQQGRRAAVDVERPGREADMHSVAQALAQLDIAVWSAARWEPCTAGSASASRSTDRTVPRISP